MNRAQYEWDVREFAAWYGTPAVLELVAHCEAGRIQWADAYRLCVRALDAGVRALAELDASGGAA